MIKIKKSEAKVLIFISNADKRFCFTKQISIKLRMDYGYCMRTLHQLAANGWLKSHQLEQKIFYELTAKAPIKQAKEIMSK